MTWMQFVDDLVGHLAWPGALVALAVAFRHPLTALIGDVTEGEAGPGGVKFKRAWRRAVDAATTASGSPVDSPGPLPGEASATASGDSPEASLDDAPYDAYHAETIPEGAIDGAHRKLADRLYAILERRRPTAPLRGADDVARLARQACDRGLIPPEVVESIDGIGVLYDLAHSAPERVTVTQAREFQSLVNATLYTLRDAQLARFRPSQALPAETAHGASISPR